MVHYLHSNTVFVVTVENIHGLDGLGDGLASTHQHAINVKGEDKGVGDRLVERGGDGRGGRL